MTATRDVTVVGGGIVGLATAYALAITGTGGRGNTRVTVIDKELSWAAHQSGRNSGVIHSGLYYSPGSSKARLARAGGEEMYEFCARHGVPVERTGKVVVATEERELPALEELARRGRANGVGVSELDGARLREREPEISGVRALFVPEAGVTDFAAVCRKLAELLSEAGVELRTGTELLSSTSTGDELVLSTTSGEIRTRRAVNCAGLHSDRVAHLAGGDVPVRILPFRGEYYESSASSDLAVHSLVYPVPDPAFPFLGVHLTRMLDGSLHVGPNAVLAPAREGYERRDRSAAHVRELAGDPGLRALARRYWRPGLAEVARSLAKPLFVRAARKLAPRVRSSDLVPAPAGVRAQAVRPDGTLVDDFLITEDAHWVHVLNAPSPAATASLVIGREIATRIRRKTPD
ncbi:malate dehydrogenase (quinone)/L-2-hydroxyglutarate oxidase [Actinopolyspora biskrensis]|uniref:Malate dehydrogenase (Quinone)/L-2-hydroxyglutarate oxidase n=1 Tax=Actinopolyspora biskrensis TaxID=1470178 RepID=A0A852YTG2_9ACTN|nr:L-2-hydroxyglutarate oxidase [Actinopolyspora biskrensis]NYH76859.1 malate dehydrogenase (quinone)/L-2-hydroxyglutarate oxidase [Actinopolyspora biskrensis]